jgi:hypothetical protein
MPGPSATAEWSEPSRWQHLVLDDDLNLVAIGCGKRERDSFEMAKKALAAKGIKIGGGEGSRTAHHDPEYEGVGTETLKAWLRYWQNASRSQAEAEELGIPREVQIARLEAELRARGGRSGRADAVNAASGSAADTTLHAEIARVLRVRGGGPMSASAIADAVNAAGRYSKRDNSAVQPEQILARVSKHLDLFERLPGGRIKVRVP